MRASVKGYIKRTDAEAALANYIGATSKRAAIAARAILCSVPNADIRPIVLARWAHPVPGDGDPYCTACKRSAPWFLGYGSYEPDFCPHCGAIMDEEAADNG